jgi:hypothetical protein
MESSMFAHNVGRADAGIRAVIGTGLLGLAAAFNARPFVALGAAALALLLLGTALTRSCPLYLALGLSTSRPPQRV